MGRGLSSCVRRQWEWGLPLAWASIFYQSWPKLSLRSLGFNLWCDTSSCFYMFQTLNFSCQNWHPIIVRMSNRVSQKICRWAPLFVYLIYKSFSSKLSAGYFKYAKETFKNTKEILGQKYSFERKSQSNVDKLFSSGQDKSKS